MVDPVPQLEDLRIERGMRVLLRADFNVPLHNGTIEDDLRITTALPTIEYLRRHGAEIVCCSHLGRPKGKVDAQFTLAPVGAKLGEGGCAVHNPRYDFNDANLTVGAAYWARLTERYLGR